MSCRLIGLVLSASEDWDTLRYSLQARWGATSSCSPAPKAKKVEATEIGAKQFVAMQGKGGLESSVGKPIKHLIITTSTLPDWKKFLPIMAPGGVIYPVTVSYDELKLPYRVITSKELRVQGTLVSPGQTHREMIEFAGLHRIKPIIETFPLNAEGITEAMNKLNAGKMRYRAVLVA